MTLAELRKRKKVTQEQTAAAVGVSPSTIAMYETGKRLPSYKVLERLGRYFDVPIGQITFDPTGSP